MLLTVPILYYKPIQERALKIKGKGAGGKKKKKTEGAEKTGRAGEAGRGGG